MVITVVVITTAILAVALLVTKRVSEDRQTFVMRYHGLRVRNIVGQAMAELVAASLIDQPEVARVKRDRVVDDLRSYWKGAGVEGVIFEGGRPLVSTVPQEEVEWLKWRIPDPEDLFRDENPRIPGPEDLHRYIGFSYVGMHVTGIPLWDWNVITISQPISLLSRNASVFFLLPLTALGMMLLGVVIALVLRQNLQQPVERVLDDLHRHGEVKPTGVSEFDDIGGAVNRAVEALAVRNAQMATLHDIALSLQSSNDLDELLQQLLEKGRIMLNASQAGMALFRRPEGAMAMVYRSGTRVGGDDIDLNCRRLFGAIRKEGALIVLRAPDAHPVYGELVTAFCPRFDNIIACPVSSGTGYMDVVLFFANLPGGVAEGDERLVRTLAADAMMAVDRIHDTGQLARFKLLVESAFDMVVIADRAGRILYANPSCLETTGFPSDEITATTLTEMHDDGTPGSPKRIREILASGHSWSGELSCRRRDRSRFTVSATIFPIAGGERGTTLVASIQRDISREKHLYEQLLRAQKMEAVGTMAGGFAHDFNNILAGILGYAELMLMQVDEAHPLYQEADTIRASALRGADLARRILSVARVEEMTARPLDVNEAIETSLQLIRHGMPKNIDIVSRLADGLPSVNGDPGQIHQVILNLLVNARDAMPQGGTLTVETALEDQRGGKSGDGKAFVRIIVADTGTGIPPEVRHRIFDPFFTTKEPDKGTGLGLYLVNMIVANHGGRVDLESQEGKGTIFSIRLPASTGVPQPARAERKPPRSGTGTILVVDDEEVIRSLCLRALGAMGYEVLTAAEPREGLKTFEEASGRIGLVLLDMVMPGMSGMEVFGEMLKMDPSVRVLFMSGYCRDDFGELKEHVGSGRVGFLGKPFTLAELSAKVESIMAPPRGQSA